MAERRSRAEQAQQAEKTRNRLATSGALSLRLLKHRRDQAIAHGLAFGLSVPMLARSVDSALQSAVAEARTFARSAGIKRLEAEAISADLEIVAAHAAARARAAQDLIRARVASASYSKRWESKATGSSVADAADVASTETAGSLKRIAVTESAEAFNEGRLYEARLASRNIDVDLYRRWDAKADACPNCAALDGQVVGVGENFSEGEPGSIHPSCCCSWELITAAEAGKHKAA